MTATEAGRIEMTIAYDVDSVDEPVNRTVELTAVELRESDKMFEYSFEPGADTRQARASFARLQSDLVENDLRDVYRQIEQRQDGLPETIVFTAADPDRLDDRKEGLNGYASYPNEIYLDMEAHERSAFSTYRLEETARHEIAHIGQSYLDAENRDDWNFLIEGHAEFESSLTAETIENKPPKEEFLDWSWERDKYMQSAAFVDAYFAEYGRQTFLEMMRNSQGTDMRTEFKEATGESFDSFYDRWMSGGPNDPATRRGDLPKVAFTYVDGQLHAEGLSYTTANVIGNWDLDGDGETDARGETVDWQPSEAGQYPITLTLDDGNTELSQTQVLQIATTDTNPLAEYANDEGIVETGGLRDAISDWRRDNAQTDLLQKIIDAWRTEEPIS
ncbi:hypothetical protein CP556_21780 [Natrinema sp. CBA1119]|nr:hypothetical protein CP556_21780 [Natrinema sp. CBA1119]